MPVGSSESPLDNPPDSRTALRLIEAVRALHAGGIVAYPTEGVYGLGCLPTDREAIERLLRVKRRSWRKGLLLIAASLEQIAPFVTIPEDGQREEILASWPGPVTWVLPARAATPKLLTGGRNTLAVRVTDHAVSRALCLQAGTPLISTSANRTGGPPLLSARAVRRAFGGDIDYVLGGPLGGLERPTAIRDGQTGAYLRGG